MVLAPAIYVLMATQKTVQESFIAKISLLSIATAAQALFFTILFNVHPVFVLIVFGCIVYPTGRVISRFESDILPELAD